MVEQTPRKPGRPRDPALEARRREEILDAAARIFARDGYADTDVQTVADELGVGKGTLYRYYASKKELFLAAVDRGIQALSAEIEAQLAAAADPLDGFRRAVRTYLSFFDRHPELVELFVQERAAFRDRRLPTYFADKQAHIDERLQYVQSLVDTHRFRPLPPQQVLDVVGDLMYGTIFTNHLTGRKVPFEVQAEQILDVIFRGLLSDTERGTT